MFYSKINQLVWSEDGRPFGVTNIKNDGSFIFSKRIIMVFSHLNRRAFITMPLSRVYTIMNQVLHIFKIDFDLFIKIDSNSTNFG